MGRPAKVEVDRPKNRISKSDAAVWLAVHSHLRETLKRAVRSSDFVDYAEHNKGPNVSDIRRLLWFDSRTDSELARQARESRARDITRVAFVIIKPVKKNDPPVRIRALVSVKDSNSGERGYVNIDEVSRKASYKRQTMLAAKSDLIAFQRRYNNLNILFGLPGGRVLDVIAQVIRQLEKLDTGK